jgi:transcriptional regulator with XRE-family HTH domain
MIDSRLVYRSIYYKRCNIAHEAICMTGLALETVRKRQGISQVQAAKLLGLSQPMLSHMETGKRNVSLDVAQRAAELFGGDPTALPVNPLPRHSDETLASELGRLGYPGYAHLSGLCQCIFSRRDRRSLLPESGSRQRLNQRGWTCDTPSWCLWYGRRTTGLGIRMWRVSGAMEEYDRETWRTRGSPHGHSQAEI